MLVGEDRDPAAKRASFFGLNRIKGEVLWENVVFEEPWWISIEAVHRDRVFLHGYSRPDMPDHQRVHVLDLFTGHTLWSRDDARFLFAADDSVFVSRDTASGRTIMELALRDGAVTGTRENDASELNAARSRVQRTAEDAPRFPLTLQETFPAGGQPAYLQEVVQRGTMAGAMEVLVNDGLCLFSYHEKSDEEGHLRNILNVVQMDNGRQVLSETLNEDVKGIVPDSFFVQEGILYFVRERSQLVAVTMADLSRT